MKTLLRSTFLVKPDESADLFLSNYLALSNSGLGFETTEDNLIWTYVQEFFRTHNHVPTLSTLRAHFERIKEMEVVDRLEQLGQFPSRTRGDFLRHLEEKAEDRKIRMVRTYLKTAAEITETGYEEKDARGKVARKLMGAVDAMRFLLEKSHDIVAPTLGSRLSGGVLGAVDTFKERYERVESDPQFGRGQFSGIKQLDETMGGCKKGELWTHAAFTGHMKSSLAMSWCYMQAVYYSNDSLYFSLEMPWEQVQNILWTMHSYHEKFRTIRIKLGIQPASSKTPGGKEIHYDRGLDYEKVKYAQLSKKEKSFLFDIVAVDFKDPANGYGEVHVEVADPDKSDFTVADARSKAEILYAKNPFSMIVFDHMGLMAPRKWVASTTERSNEVIRDTKRLAMSFNRGQGIAVLGLFQINRDGFRAAEKNEGKYNLTHLAYANECEKSSDVVSASWIDDDLRKQGRFYMQCLKSRDVAPFERFGIRVEFHCRRLLTDESGVEMIDAKQENEAIGDEIDLLEDL